MSVRADILQQLHRLMHLDMHPTAIYLDPKSHAELMHECSIGETYPAGTFQWIPLFSVRDCRGSTDRHVIVHGDRT